MGQEKPVFALNRASRATYRVRVKSKIHVAENLNFKCNVLLRIDNIGIQKKYFNPLCRLLVVGINLFEKAHSLLEFAPKWLHLHRE